MNNYQYLIKKTEEFAMKKWRSGSNIDFTLAYYDLSPLNIDGAHLKDESFYNCKIINSSCKKTVFEHCRFVRCEWINTNFEDAKFIDCTFEHCDMTFSKFHAAIFDNCTIKANRFDACDFKDFINTNTDFKGSTFIQTKNVRNNQLFVVESYSFGNIRKLKGRCSLCKVPFKDERRSKRKTSDTHHVPFCPTCYELMTYKADALETAGLLNYPDSVADKIEFATSEYEVSSIMRGAATCETRKKGDINTGYGVGMSKGIRRFILQPSIQTIERCK